MGILKENHLILVVILLTILNFSSVLTELTPPYFNLAEGRKISATATCGDTDAPELYCKLVGANAENDNHLYKVIQGQVCDYCDPSRPDTNHPPEYAIDGTENWWQSPPLSRGMKYNEVNLTIDFGQEFHVAYLFVRMGNSPRPGLWTLEKSSDYGKTWKAWQHFSDTASDCELYFGVDSLRPIQNDDDVICTTEYSKIVPLENGEIPVMLLNNRPSANNYFNSTILQEWTRATNVRFRFLRTKNLLGHLMSVARQDPTVTRRYFYSIKDISIGGRCMCNGHADTCHVLDPLSPTRILACQCRHNTCGIQCADCCPGFEQKKWRQNTNARPFQCEPCNCFGHSNTCIYDEETDARGLSLDIHGNFEGGGICQNCQHNTEGINCNKCKAKFYRPYGKYWNETDVCSPCNCNTFFSTGNCEENTGRCECRTEYQEPDCTSCSYGHFGYPNCRECECNLNGTDGYYCQATSGVCPCKANFAGDYCKKCSNGYFNYPKCESCQCNRIGSINDVCDFETGQCSCNTNFDGLNCEQCKNGYFSYPTCKYCNCELQGTELEICDKSNGKCLCKEGYGGARCDQCLPGYYNYPNCIPCNCSILGSVSMYCDASGKCPCLSNYAGKQCTLCSTGYYSYPECLPCNCDIHGANGISCNVEGQCLCLNNFDGKNCDECKEGFYNFPACEECNCDPAGVITRFAGCGSVPAGELCQCKERVHGRICDQCKPLYWNLNISNPDGCEDCDCFVDGAIGSLDTCDSKTGQCACKPSVTGRSCHMCKDGSFDLFGGSLFGCKDCGCDIGGSVHGICNKITGKCVCHPRVAGRTCTQPLATHYYPTLFQYQFEYEDGYTPTGANVRYLFDEEQFPNFSKRGYAKFSSIQSEVINEVTIFRSSVYRMIIRYVNPNDENVIGQILITSDNPNEVDQSAKVLFKPTNEPQFVTVSGSKGEIPSPIVLDPGRYTISMKTDKLLYLDYFVLLPAAYYESSILTRKIENPCEIGNTGLCRHYKYPLIDEFKPVYDSFIVENEKPIKPTEIYDDFEHLTILNEDQVIPVITPSQQTLNYIVEVPRSGRYIIVVDYITHRTEPETYILKVNFAGDDEQDGVVTLYPCTYTTVCRQPVIDAESREKVFFFDTTDVRPIQVIGDEETHVGIKSITAIPVNEWSIDLITPNPACVMVDGKCVQATFRAAPDSKKIEFEYDHEDKIAKINPIDVFDNSTKLIYLNVDQSTIEVQSKVPHPGRYHVIVQFYQPDHPKFDINFKIQTEKQIYDGKLPLRNCPSNSGCREMIKQDNGYTIFDIEDDITLTFTNNLPKGVWLDYILLVPADQFHDNLLREDQFDQTKEFIQNCGQDHFDIKLNASSFCKQAVFSLTSDYNSGTLPCQCDDTGSTSFECDPFGGQCECKIHVIGRQCDQCKTGYYGFPDCKPCDCPAPATCEKETGECICPPRVIGEKCDKCEPYTFGFDQIIGCESCNCNEMGVDRGNLQCDLNNGTCQCRPHIEGRTCDDCINGFFNFPHCEPCRCNPDGTTLDICDKMDETCFCKKNVIGSACDRCIDGTYNLHHSNPEGCTKCFCFGRTSRCDRAYLRSFNVSMLKDASINTIDVSVAGAQISRWPLTPYEIIVNETMLEVDLSVKDVDEDLIYFGVLDYLLDQNNHLTAYGGYLTYKIYYTTGPFGKALIGPDVILEGKDLVIVHQSYEQPANAHNFYGSVKMVETNFQTISGASVSRDQFMVILRDLNAIYIRATYWEQTIVSRVSDVYLTMADEDEENYNLYEELAVEKCHCPPGYVGLSCEDCAPGYYRDPNGPFGGFCVPCQCNGHASTCNCNTGICDNCKHFTTGDHCEKCIVGYHGNATFGTPHDCMICACPMPIESNNFATSCEISDDGYQIHCTCREGYTGARCQSCAHGYYGLPEKEGEICRPCECSGNINPSEPGACDSVTGECLRCLNNTFGQACNLCAPGFYGDAIKLKDCQSCICDELGTEHCDSYIGTCHCHNNVIGDKCDRCEIDHYGFDSGLGCRSCDCAIASNSTQCDDHTGECRCKPGVTGRQCDRCLPGYWNYTTNGCLPCSCNTDYSRGLGCNAMTGQCECLPGVVGEKCDACPHRWVLIPDTGCHICDICHHALLDVTDNLRTELDPVIHEFETVASGYFTAQKLNYYNDLVDKIEPEVRALDPNGVNLTPLRQEIDTLEMDTKNLDRRIHYAEQTAKDRAHGSDRLLNESSDVLYASRFANSQVKNTIREVEKLAQSFYETESSTKIDNAIDEAEKILDNLKAYAIETNATGRRLNDTNDFYQSIQSFSVPVQDQFNSLESLKNNIGTFSDKLSDLMDWSDVTIKACNLIKPIHLSNLDARVTLKYDTVTNQSKEAQKNIADTGILARKGDITLSEILKHLATLNDVNTDLKELSTNVDALLPDKEIEYDNLVNITEQAVANQNKLVRTAKILSSELSNITANSETALKAANAYKDIADAVNTARDAIKNAKFAAGNATELCNGIEDRAVKSDNVASELLNEARASLNKVQSELQPHLNKSAQAVNDIINKNQHSDDQNTAINESLDHFRTESQQTNVWEESRDKAIAAKRKANDTLEILKPILKNLKDDVENAKQMPKKFDDVRKDIVQATNQVDRVKTLLPNLKELFDEVNTKQDHVNKMGSDLGERMERLRRQIDTAREIANSIKVGVNFHPNTTLELPSPENLQLLGINSRVSAYFRTNKPNGFLMYLGNVNKTIDETIHDDRRTEDLNVIIPTTTSSPPIFNKRNDFMAIEIENGYPILSVDLGNGPQKIISNKYVANDQWHQVIVERTGDKVKLIVREELEDGKEQLHEVEDILPGTDTIFNLDKENSKLFVGGYPPDFNMQDSLKYSSFEGQIEDLRIGDDEIGLWNFIDGQDNNHGARERDRLITSDKPATGYRFSGHGYVILDAKPYSFKQRSSIQFKFKTGRDTMDGLMFYAGKHRHFISVEMHGGSIYFQYKLGQHVVTIGSVQPFNDDQWHKVDAERSGRSGKLTIDGAEIYKQETAPGSEENLKISDSLYFGGYPGKINHTEVINKNFDGCIDDVHISGTPIDLSQNLKAYGVRQGCPEKFSAILSYAPPIASGVGVGGGGGGGYLRKTNVSSANHLQINMKFKTIQQHGILFYATNHDQSGTFGLTLRNGALVLTSMKNELSTDSAGGQLYNNGEWHVVTARHDAKQLQLHIDEMNLLTRDISSAPPLIINYGDIYFGGIPKGYRTPKKALGNTAYFVGCISDVTINGQIVNFANSTDRKSAILDNCARDLLEYDVTAVPIYYPDGDGGDDGDEHLNEIDSENEKMKAIEEKKLQEEKRRKEEEMAEEEKNRLAKAEEEAAKVKAEEERRQKELEEELNERKKQEEIDKEKLEITTTSSGEPMTTVSSSTKRPTRPRPTYDPKMGRICLLPVEPEIHEGFDDVGYRFGTTGNSRIEFSTIPSKLKTTYDIALQFKTTQSDGVLFYVADSRQYEFISLYLQNGLLSHIFTSAKESANMTSNYQYNDNKWHNVVISRQQTKGYLFIDGHDNATSELSNSKLKTISVREPYSFGGVDKMYLEDVNLNLRLEKGKYFTGCIRNIQMGGRSLGSPAQSVGVLPCSEDIEDGIFFGKSGGYVKLRERFKVGTEITIQFDIKPRTMNGLLLSVHGKKAYLILQLINGTINFTVDNGDGEIVAVYKPDENENFCDGEWRTITAIKSQYVITIMVNSLGAQPSIGSATSPSTDTSRPLFLGGHPHLSKVRGLTARRPYLGCIRNFKINETPEKIHPEMTVGNILTGVCPLN